MAAIQAIGTETQTQRLAAFVANFTYRDLPDHVAQRGREILLDTLGALLAASSPRYSAARIITDFVRSQGGTPESSVVGRDFKTSSINAALANGTLGYYCDIEAHHPGAVLHPAAVVVPTALAVGERERADGRRFLAAMVLGVEVACRVSSALDPRGLYRRGFHPSSVAGCFGAAAAAGSLLGLDVPQLCNALGLAGTQASGLLAWASDLTEHSRPFNPGIAARNGTTAALLAHRGFGGPPDIFGGKYDIFAAFSGERHVEALTANFGQHFRIMELAIKLYSCCAFIHPALDGLLKIVTDHGVDIDDVDRVDLRFATSGVGIIDNNELKSHCAQYILAVATLDHKILIDDILQDRRSDPRIQRLSERVRVIGDTELEKTYPDQYRSIIELTTSDGRRFVEQVDWPRGYPQNPISREELEAKFLGLATTVVDRAHAERIARVAERVEELTDIGELAALLRVTTRSS